MWSVEIGKNFKSKHLLLNMKVMQVIHGYPPEYNAGSENYTKTITEELLRQGHSLFVFSREENPFLPEYNLRKEIENKGKLTKYTINLARTKDRFINMEVNLKFIKVLESVQPDIVHFQHLNHLSLSLPLEVGKMNIPSIYTLHDFWLMCPRGQFLQTNLSGEPWNLCDGQDDKKCAKICYNRYFTGKKDSNEDISYWTNWVKERMNNSRKVVQNIGAFVSPSRTVSDYFKQYFPQDKNKVQFLDYGFNLQKLSGRKRVKEERFVFGYIGTHIPAKGINYLINAIGQLHESAILRIWGRYRSDSTSYLKKLSMDVLDIKDKEIQWMGEFDGDRIVEQVFDNVDAIVVPSIWLENSPLVIHEAQQVGVPVITADVGGMREYVENGVNGLTFDFRNVKSLTEKMEIFLRQPEFAKVLGSKRYLYTDSGDIPSVEHHVNRLLELYNKLISQHT
jgi:glycosyltransferase involved in cell wall biosynthesis